MLAAALFALVAQLSEPTPPTPLDDASPLLTVAYVFTTGMVLQRSPSRARIWGKFSPYLHVLAKWSPILPVDVQTVQRTPSSCFLSFLI